MTSFKKRRDGITIFCLCFTFCLFMPSAESINLINDFYTQNGQFGACSESITGEKSAFLRSHVGAYQFGSLIGYRANEDCAVGFDAGEGKQVLVQFLRFSLQEPTNSVCDDYVMIDELGRTDNATYCGSQVISPYVSDAENITIIFYSDSTTELSGFKILLTSFRTAAGACQPGEFKCDVTRCIDNSLKCDGVTHCVDGTDEENQQAGCTWFDHVLGAVLSLGEHTILAIGILAGTAIVATITAVVVYHVVIKKKNRVIPIQPTTKAKTTSVATTSDHSKSSKTASSSKSSDKHKKATGSSSKKATTKKAKKVDQVEDDVDW
ncbi:neuropilin and tolloid-like protein 2 [Ylistrum balloti]|uniref:neuropilin and tolloid-like protein 2 n=1 Tax=Ylistrum balloti TaxID=509963 RepID=UPI002905B12E|nr:neuropilin and tolloid-like protein 2 [Ylistrum balloti]